MRQGRVTRQGMGRTRGVPAARPCPARPGQEQGKDARPCQGRPRPRRDPGPALSITRPGRPEAPSGPVGVEAVQRVGAVAGGELAAEIADVQAALLAQAQAAAPRRVMVREQRARLLGGQELLVRLLGHGGGRGGGGSASGGGGSASGTRRRRRRHQRPVPGRAALSRPLLPAPRPHSAPCRGEGARRAGGAAMAAGAAQGLGEGGGGRGFLGPRVPAEVEAMARGVQDVGKETFRRLLKGRARAGPAARRPAAEGPRCPRTGTRGVPGRARGQQPRSPRKPWILSGRQGQLLESFQRRPKGVVKGHSGETVGLRSLGLFGMEGAEGRPQSRLQPPLERLRTDGH